MNENTNISVQLSTGLADPVNATFNNSIVGDVITSTYPNQVFITAYALSYDPGSFAVGY